MVTSNKGFPECHRKRSGDAWWADVRRCCWRRESWRGRWRLVLSFTGAGRAWEARSVPTNWNPAGVPGERSTPYLWNDDAQDRTLNYDYAGPAVTLDMLSVDQVGLGTNTFQMAGLLSTRQTYLGGYGKAVSQPERGACTRPTA